MRGVKLKVREERGQEVLFYGLFNNIGVAFFIVLFLFIYLYLYIKIAP